MAKAKYGSMRVTVPPEIADRIRVLAKWNKMSAVEMTLDLLTSRLEALMHDPGSADVLLFDEPRLPADWDTFDPRYKKEED